MRFNTESEEPEVGYRKVEDLLHPDRTAAAPRGRAGKPARTPRIDTELEQEAQAYAAKWNAFFSRLIDWRYPMLAFLVSCMDMVIDQRGTALFKLIWAGIIAVATSAPMICAVQTRKAFWVNWATQIGAGVGLGLFASEVLLITLGLKNV